MVAVNFRNRINASSRDSLIDQTFNQLEYPLYKQLVDHMWARLIKDMWDPLYQPLTEQLEEDHVHSQAAD